MFNLNDPHSRSFARAAGVGYLAIALAGGFSIAFVPAQIQVAGDIAATIENLREMRPLYLAGIAGDTIVLVAEVLVTALLFMMFRRVQPTLSLIAALARFAMVAVMGAMLLFSAGIWHLTGADTMPGLDEELRQHSVALLYYIHDAGVWVWQVFFWLHLMALGTLVLKSGAFPRWLGWGLLIGSFGYLLDSIFAFAFPEVALLGQIRIPLLVIVSLSEITFALWLVIRGPGPALGRHTAQPG